MPANIAFGSKQVADTVGETEGLLQLIERFYRALVGVLETKSPQQ